MNEEDLDRNIDYVLPVDIFKRMRSYMEPFGVMPELSVPYDSACQEGWAPPPTNQYQKAVWDKVHAIPDKPLTMSSTPRRTSSR